MKEISEIEILLVEDNIDDANLAIRALRKNNLANQLFHVKDGVEALDFIYGQGQFARPGIIKPKLIILDVKMPKIDGKEVLKKLKGDKLTKHIPVVMLTSYKDPDIITCYDLGANSYIVKPVEFDKFQKTVSEIGMYWLMINQPSTS